MTPQNPPQNINNFTMEQLKSAVYDMMALHQQIAREMEAVNLEISKRNQAQQNIQNQVQELKIVAAEAEAKSEEVKPAEVIVG